MNRSKRMQIQAVAVLFGIFFLFLLVIAGLVIGIGRKEQPQGAYITGQDARILLEAAGIPWEPNADAQAEAENITFAEVTESFGNITELKEKLAELNNRYEPEHAVLQEDWYALYDACLAAKGLTDSITRVEFVPLGKEGEQLITEDGAYPFRSPEFLRYRFLCSI